MSFATPNTCAQRDAPDRAGSIDQHLRKEPPWFQPLHRHKALSVWISTSTISALLLVIRFRIPRY